MIEISAIQNNLPGVSIKKNIEAPSGDEKFGNVLTDFIGQVNQQQFEADKLTQNFVQGGNVEIQDVMIAGEKAKTSLQLLMEIRNKALDMYKELTRMQV